MSKPPPVGEPYDEQPPLPYDDPRMLGAPVVVIPATLPYVEPKSEHIKVQKENDEKYKEDNKPKPPKDLTS